MLTLSRKRMQAIKIGDDILIVIGRIGTNNVRIGIDAPAEMSIRRVDDPQLPITRSSSPTGNPLVFPSATSLPKKGGDPCIP